ncbi:unnamed protein product [Pipistrellus nathusii]|uniref:Uncharacterized protein n=1 Tax=Pipistrellus nathusii TaxID=59473 RepID=A0ABP0A1L7_PIPNA
MELDALLLGGRILFSETSVGRPWTSTPWTFFSAFLFCFKEIELPAATCSWLAHFYGGPGINFGGQIQVLRPTAVSSQEAHPLPTVGPGGAEFASGAWAPRCPGGQDGEESRILGESGNPKLRHRTLIHISAKNSGVSHQPLTGPYHCLGNILPSIN